MPPPGWPAFKAGNAAATLLILRATDLFDPGRSQTAATQLALVLYVLYNVAATAISIPAGRHGDRFNRIRVLSAGAVCFAAGYGVFAAAPPPAVATRGRVHPGRARHRLRRDRRVGRRRHPGSRPPPRFGIRAAGHRASRRQPHRQRGRGSPVDRGIPVAAFLFLAGAMTAAVPLILVANGWGSRNR